MKKLMLPALLGLLLTSAALPALAAGPVDVGAGIDVLGKYVWRGMVVTPDPVVQPWAEVGLMGFSAGFWGNIDTNDANDTDWEFNEIDWTLGWSMGLPMVELGAGLIYYDFPTADTSTTELYLHAGLNVLLSPSLTFYQDLDAIEGTYWDAGISHGVALSPATNLELSAHLGLGSEGYIGGYFGGAAGLPGVPELPGGANMTDASISAAVPFNLALFFTLTPSLTYTTLLGDVKDVVDAGDAVYHGESDAFFWGLSASFTF